MHAVWLTLTFIVPSLLVLAAGVVIGLNIGYDRGYSEGLRAGRAHLQPHRPVRLQTRRPARLREATR